MINSLELGKKVIKDKIPLIPKNPGVYRMINVSGEILYIGKAKNIPNRLKSYTSDSNLPIRTERMLSLTHNLEITTTNNDSRGNYKTSFVNNATESTINGLTVKQRQSLTDALKPKADN